MAILKFSGRSLATALAGAAFAALAATAPAVTAKVCIDPGHGGSDPGAVGNGQQEKANVLDTSSKLKSWLDTDSGDGAGGGSWTVIRTRTSDVYVSLSGRTTYANNNSANRFMSIHNNGFGSSSANGIETFSYSSSGSGADLRNKVQQEALGVWPLTNRGNKTANFYVIKYTSMPAELHEMAFITNGTDASYLGNSTHRNNHAKSEMWALQRHYGLSKYTPGSAVVVTADNGSGAWSASSSWFPGTSVSGYYGSNYHARATQAISDAATWTVNLPSSGSYKVQAWWTAAGNRSTSAPYIVYHNGGSTTVNKNQQANGSSWQTLGTFSFGSGSNQVKLSCWAASGYFVIGDAIRFTKV